MNDIFNDSNEFGCSNLESMQIESEHKTFFIS
jgi:hypothetical protein